MSDPWNVIADALKHQLGTEDVGAHANAIVAELGMKGFAIVPVEPDQEMMKAGWRNAFKQEKGLDYVRPIWQAMLRAATEAETE